MLWNDKALIQFKMGWHRPAIDFPVNVNAQVYRDAERGDLIGYLQGIADILQGAGVLIDDKWIEGWDGSRQHKDNADPRVELLITPL